MKSGFGFARVAWLVVLGLVIGGLIYLFRVRNQDKPLLATESVFTPLPSLAGYPSIASTEDMSRYPAPPNLDRRVTVTPGPLDIALIFAGGSATPSAPPPPTPSPIPVTELANRSGWIRVVSEDGTWSVAFPATSRVVRGNPTETLGGEALGITPIGPDITPNIAYGIYAIRNRDAKSLRELFQERFGAGDDIRSALDAAQPFVVNGHTGIAVFAPAPGLRAVIMMPTDTSIIVMQLHDTTFFVKPNPPLNEVTESLWWEIAATLEVIDSRETR